MDFLKLNVASFYLEHFILLGPLLFLHTFQAFYPSFYNKQEYRIAKGIPANHCTIEHCRILGETMIENNGCAPTGKFAQKVMRAISY
jgi:hypothetical protein